MKMKIHFGFILFFISSSLFASSKAEGGNRQIEETEEKRGISEEIETLNVQLQILSLLNQIKDHNNEVIKEISSGLWEVTMISRENMKEISNVQMELAKHVEENTKAIKEVSTGLRENTKVIKEISTRQKENTEQAEEDTKVIKEISNGLKENTKVIQDFISKIKDNTNGIKENTDEIKKITINIKDITDGIGKNNKKETEVSTEINEITSAINQDINGLEEIINCVTNSTKYPEEIQDFLILARNCDDLRQKGDENSGIRTVHPYPDSPRKSIKVLCDQQTEEGGWTVFQLRENLPERENFQRNWKDYSHGFGNLNGEFWMGLELINVMSKLDVMELRVDLEDDTGEKRFAKYESFSIEDEDEKFKLNIGSYNGTAGDSLSYHNQRPFSTMDQDHDEWSSGSCAVTRKAAWWYGYCHHSNLNGLPHVGKYSSSYADGIDWHTFRKNLYSMAKSKMMFRLSGRIN